jgi:carboxylesterase
MPSGGHAPFEMGSGRRACLLVHGIAASPVQMRALAESIAAVGLKARAILLPGHGTRPDDLLGVKWRDWNEHLHEEYCALKKDHDEITLIGFSIGAALCAHYAAHNPVDRLIMMNAPLCPLNGRFPTGLMLRIYGLFFSEVKGNPQVFVGPDGEPFSLVYDRVPTSILHTMSELVGAAKKSLNRILSPVLIIQSRKDMVAGARSGPLAYRSVGSLRKHLVMLERSGHSMMTDADRHLVFTEILGFLKGE